MKYFTGDTHFNHYGIIDHCLRPFKTVEEMNKTLIDNWNAVVWPGDIVYHLGDFALKPSNNFIHHVGMPIDKIIDSLNGQIFLIRGNHDDKNMADYEHMFIKVDYIKYMKTDDGSKAMMCHYPMRSWRAQDHGSYHLHGHSHGRTKPMGRMMDVGVDACNFHPIPWSMIKVHIDKTYREETNE